MMQGMMPTMMPGGQQSMQQGMQMMPTMMQQGMQMMPMGMGMMPMGMGSPMGMMPMGMMNMCTNASQNTDMPKLEADANIDGGVYGSAGMTTFDTNAPQFLDTKTSGSKPTKSSRHHAEASENLADVDLGTKILVKYQHPTLGKIKYE